MKIETFKHPWSWLRAAAVMTALLLTACKLTAAPVVDTLTGGPYQFNPNFFGFVDGDTAAVAQFHTPIGMALDSSQNYLFVADRDNNAIRELDLAANYTFTFADASVGINKPVGVALDGGGNLYVLNRGNGNNGTVQQFDSFGYVLATPATALTNANGIALDNLTNIYVTVGSNTVIRISPTGVQTTVATITNAGAHLQGITVMSGGNLAVCDSGRHGILLIDPSTNNAVTNLTGFNGVGTNFGTKAFAKFNQPYGVAAAGGGILVVTDYGNNRVKVVDALGTVTNLYGVSSNYWVTGPGTFPGWWDGTVARGDLNYNVLGTVEARLPAGVIFTSIGDLYTTEDYYHLIRKVTGAGLPLPPPPPPATAPTIFSVTTNFGQVSLSWSTVAGAATYNVKRSPSSGGPYTIIGNTASSSFTDNTVINGTTYYYVVSAVNAGGEGPNSAEVSATPPLPPVPDPQIGWVSFPPTAFTSVFNEGSSFVFNNDVPIVIIGDLGSQTFYEFGPTSTNIPSPTTNSASAPVGYEDGLFSVVGLTVAQVLPDLTIKAVGVKNDGSPNSAIVSARFQFIVGNPLVTGNNAAQFAVTNITAGAEMFYTTDGTDPTNDSPSIGPITNTTTLSVPVVSNLTFKIRGFKVNYQPSAVVTTFFSATNFDANKISFGFPSGEASSEFIAAPGQFFYAPVTMNVLPLTRIYSLQFNLTVTNDGPNPGPAVANGALGFESFLEKPIPGTTPVIFVRIPPAMFSAYASNPPPANQIIYPFDPIQPFVNLIVTNGGNNLLGVGWLERFGQTNLYDTTKQDLIKFSQPHDTIFLEDNGRVVLGGFAFQVPGSATAGQTYQIQIGRPSATSDGIGAPGSDVFITTPTNGSLTAGVINSIKYVTAGQRKYIAGDSAPFRWLNAGDFGNTNLNNSDVEQVFQSAIYSLDNPPAGSDFFDSMDSCGYAFIDLGNGYLEQDFGTLFSGTSANPLFDGNDTTINQIAFGDGVLDVCDIYVTFRRSLDPSLVWFRRFWTNGIRAAEIVGNPPPPPVPLPAPAGAASVNFASADFIASAGQTIQIPVTAQVAGAYPLRTLMLNLSVKPLDGSPELTSPVQFAANPSLGQPGITSSRGNGNYAATWLNNSIAGLTGTATLGTLTVQVPASAGSSAAYAVHFDHASASPNGLASFPKHMQTGLITRSDRSASSWNDGISDAWRLRYFGTLNNVLSAATADADGDGVNNLEEFKAATNPNDASSVFRLGMKRGQAKDITVRWPSVANKQYVIERATDLYSPAWTAIATNTGTGFDMELHETNSGGNSFYRVRMLP